MCLKRTWNWELPVSEITLVLGKNDLRQADNSGFPGVNHPWTINYDRGDFSQNICLYCKSTKFRVPFNFANFATLTDPRNLKLIRGCHFFCQKKEFRSPHPPT